MTCIQVPVLANIKEQKWLTFEHAAGGRWFQGNHSYDDSNVADIVKSAVCLAVTSPAELCCVHEWQ